MGVGHISAERKRKWLFVLLRTVLALCVAAAAPAFRMLTIARLQAMNGGQWTAGWSGDDWAVLRDGLLAACVYAAVATAGRPLLRGRPRRFVATCEIAWFVVMVGAMTLHGSSSVVIWQQYFRHAPVSSGRHWMWGTPTR